MAEQTTNTALPVAAKVEEKVQRFSAYASSVCARADFARPNIPSSLQVDAAAAPTAAANGVAKEEHATEAATPSTAGISEKLQEAKSIAEGAVDEVKGAANKISGLFGRK